MTGAAFLGIDVDPERIKKRLKTGYCDFMVTTLDEALRILKNAVRKKEKMSPSGWSAIAPTSFRNWRNVASFPTSWTDHDLASHDPLNGYVPNGMTFEAALELRQRDPQTYQEKSLDAMARHVEGMLRLQKMGSITFDYGNNIRTFAFQRGVKNAYDFPGFVPAYIRPLFCEGRGPFRWVALSGEPSDIHVTDDLVLELFPDNRILRRWIDLARKRIKFQGLPARICWLGYGERAQFGLAMNELVKRGKIKAPIVIGRDHLDCGSVASPFRETESMKDGSDAVADWPLLNALLNTAAGASWVSIHNGGGVGIGYSLHAGQVTVADGTDMMAKRIERVLTTDPGMGIIRHADAGVRRSQGICEEDRRKGANEPEMNRRIGNPLLLVNVGQLLTLRSASIKPGPSRGSGLKELSIIKDGAVLCMGGKIWSARWHHLKTRFATHGSSRNRNVTGIDCAGKVVVPGFVDSHTHPVFVGPRLVDFEKRVEGASYERNRGRRRGHPLERGSRAQGRKDSLGRESLDHPARHGRARHDDSGGQVGLWVERRVGTEIA